MAVHSTHHSSLRHGHFVAALRLACVRAHRDTGTGVSCSLLAAAPATSGSCPGATCAARRSLPPAYLPPPAPAVAAARPLLLGAAPAAASAPARPHPNPPLLLPPPASKA